MSSVAHAFIKGQDQQKNAYRFIMLYQLTE